MITAINEPIKGTKFNKNVRIPKNTDRSLEKQNKMLREQLEEGKAAAQLSAATAESAQQAATIAADTARKTSALTGRGGGGGVGNNASTHPSQRSV